MRFKLTFYMVSGKSYEIEVEKDSYAQVAEEVRSGDEWLLDNGRLVNKRNVEYVEIANVRDTQAFVKQRTENASVMQ